MAPLADHEDPREFDGRGVDITWRSWRRGVGARNRVDVDEVAVLGEAIDEGHDAGRAWKDSAPLLVGQVGRDDGDLGFVATINDVAEKVGGATFAGQVPKLVENQDVRRQIALAEATFESGQ